MTLRILLLGKIGQLGWELQRTLAPLGEITAFDYPEVDFSHPSTLAQVVQAAAPQVVINAVAYTAVDKAETEESLARAINAAATGELAQAARKAHAAFLHVSTDYVFDGRKGSPYVEEDTPHPLNVYGQTKLEGEQAALQAGGAVVILRTAWVYSTRRDSFVTKVLGWSRNQSELRLVNDQISNPTWARMLAGITALLLAKSRGDPFGYLDERSGLYHLAGDGYASRMEWAQEILKLDPNPEQQTARKLIPANTSEFPTPAVRPLFSALNCEHFTQVFGLRLPPWQLALRQAMDPLR
ncbi:dTDP-4-dehydrorhamnose reductase [Longilinea arvoryzae]|uniref:dTDP-4-dehydrorhamnose reductase n=1 Tax=Longilinea arvoryzae TaxID=360412 RepID=A0A0S7BEP9_9CHLR|nr:dTDP-4-dehydrorhamnose reductase [Longilinea arvoryzae]GAP13945.1 dTDP-4-dehydrorhamnose reductase [Longilinea arvoryzae]